MKTLTLKLTGPLQSYGNEADFLLRTTGGYPSKSAIIGLIAAALGYQRTDTRIVALNDLKFAVRVDQPGSIMTEFQTVEVQETYSQKKAKRKVTHRDNLQDALFMVALGSSDDELLNRIKFALHHPKFQLFLGRRANVIAGYLEVNEYPNEDPVTVLMNLDWQAAAWYQKQQRWQHADDKKFTVTLAADADLLPHQSGQDFLVKDHVRSFSQMDRRHAYRAVVEKSIELDTVAQQKEN